MKNADAKYIVLFDDVCNLCNGTVQFILKHDKNKQFCFGSLQGKAGQGYLRQFQLPAAALTTFILIEGETAYTRSTGALRILKHLGGGWQLLYAFIIVPRFIRDTVYNLVAKNRYKWFGKKEDCPVPAAEQHGRFLL